MICNSYDAPKDKDNKILIKHNETIDKVSTDFFKRKSYNTAIAAVMEFFNSLSKSIDEESISCESAKICISTIAKLLYPITPHISFAILSETKSDKASNPQWPEKIEDSMLSSAWHFYLNIEKSKHHHLRLVRT